MTLFGASVKAVKCTDKKCVENHVLESLVPLLLFSQDDNDEIAKVMPVSFQPSSEFKSNSANSVYLLEDTDCKSHSYSLRPLAQNYIPVIFLSKLREIKLLISV